MTEDEKEFDEVYKTLQKLYGDFMPILFPIERVLGRTGRGLSRALNEAVILAGEIKIASLEEK